MSSTEQINEILNDFSSRIKAITNGQRVIGFSVRRSNQNESNWISELVRSIPRWRRRRRRKMNHFYFSIAGENLRPKEFSWAFCQMQASMTRSIITTFILNYIFFFSSVLRLYASEGFFDSISTWLAYRIFVCLICCVFFDSDSNFGFDFRQALTECPQWCGPSITIDFKSTSFFWRGDRCAVVLEFDT